MTGLLQPTLAQTFEIQTVVEGTPQISLDLISEPIEVTMDVWVNWTLRLEVLEGNRTPRLRVLIRSEAVNFSEFNNVSFGLNRTAGSGFSVSLKFIHYLHVFTTFDLGNLTEGTVQTLICTKRINGVGLLIVFLSG